MTRLILKSRKRRNHEEDDECVALVQWCYHNGISFYHLPQETWVDTTKNPKMWAVMARNKKLGVRKGVFDYIIFKKTKIGKKGEIAFIEMKKKKGGVVSDEQKVFQLHLHDCGIANAICNGADEAIEFISKL